MSTSAVSSTSLSQQLQEYFQTRQSDLQQLGQALGSGDLADAQTAYNNIVTLGQSGPVANGNPFFLNQREQDFSAIGQALQSGDLAGAQQAFSALKTTFQRGAAAQNPTGTSPASSAGPEIVLNLSSGSGGTSTAPGSTPASGEGPEIVVNLSGSTSPEQITIDINNQANGGGEQVSLSVGSQGSNPQPQITFNLSPNSNEQIVLNLLSEPTSSSGSVSNSSSGGGLSVSA
jgi:hypothetical protein